MLLIFVCVDMVFDPLLVCVILCIRFLLCASMLAYVGDCGCFFLLILYVYVFACVLLLLMLCFSRISEVIVVSPCVCDVALFLWCRYCVLLFVCLCDVI